MKNSFALLFVLILIGVSSRAEEVSLPTLRKGMWSFTSTVQGADGKKSPAGSYEHCESPSEVWRKRQILATENGYKFSPIKKDGNTYISTYEWTVNYEDGTSDSFKGKKTVIMEGPDAYTEKTETETKDKITTTKIVTAKRIGDCPEKK